TSGGSASSGGGGGEDTGKWKKEEEAGITTVVKKLLTSEGSVIEDFRTNSLIVTDIPSRIPVIAQTIAALDMPVAQVMLEVEMLDVSKNAVDKIGFKFGQTPFTVVLTGSSMGLMWPFGGTNLPLSAIRQFAPGNIAVNTGSNTYTVMLDFLKTQTDTKYLARPRILTLNNETAEIKITTSETVGVISQVTTGASTTSSTTPERVTTGVTLRVTPQINSDTGEITMFIMPEVKDVSTSSFLIGNTGSTFYKDPETRSTKSVVRVKDGDTIVVGGLIRNERTETYTKLPILGDLPLVGLFFRHRNKEKDRERELLVFITPRLLKNSDAQQLAAANKVTLPEREQNTATGVRRQDIIGASLNRFEEKRK
ncbi:MAG: secretin N-terminal domain-containing protein, partial [Candidatus Omnitrophota bacterium]